MHQQLVVVLVPQDLCHLCHGIVVVGILLRLGHGSLVLVLGGYVGGVLLRYPTSLYVFVQIGSSALSGNGGVVQQEFVCVAKVEVPCPPAPHSSHEGAGVVAVEEGGHVSALLVAAVHARLDDVAGHVGCYHAQQDELVAVCVPERGVGVVPEVSLLHVALCVEVFAVHVAPQYGPEECPVHGAVEQSLLPLGASLYPDVRKDVLPCLVCCRAHLVEVLVHHLRHQVLLGVLHADEAEAYLQFQRLVSLVVLEVHHRYGLPLGSLLCHAAHGQVSYGIEVHPAVSVLVALEGIGCRRLPDVPVPWSSVVLGDVHQQAFLVGRPEGISMEGAP